MTENFVPFILTLEYNADTSVSNKGSLILQKDNPSGLPENDDAFFSDGYCRSAEIPIQEADVEVAFLREQQRRRRS